MIVLIAVRLKAATCSGVRPSRSEGDIARCGCIAREAAGQNGISKDEHRVGEAGAADGGSASSAEPAPLEALLLPPFLAGPSLYQKRAFTCWTLHGRLEPT